MAIDGLSSTSALLAALRAEVTKKGERTGKDNAAQTAASIAHTHDPKRHDAAALRRELSEIVKGISPDDDAAMDTARPRVVRAVLLWEFGPALREYSEWQPMLDRLVSTLESSAQHRSQFAGLIRELRT
jgi:hypothetical protein